MADRLVLVGGSGLVGTELSGILRQQGHADSVHEVNAACYEPQPSDVAFLCVPDAQAIALRPALMRANARVVDCSAAFRARPDVPLLVPEVEGAVLACREKDRWICSPNCSTTMLVVALEPLRRAFGLRRVAVTTYQAVSGAGRAALLELGEDAAAALAGRPFAPKALPERAAFNVFCHESEVDAASGANGEERKIVAETRRIWGLPQLPIDAACARVGTRQAHCQSVLVELAGPAELAAVQAALSAAPSVRLLMDPSGHGATAQDAVGQDCVLAARVRWAQGDLDLPPGDRRRVSLWLACDQLRKGAALNAVQIAAALGWLPRQ